MSCEVCGKTVEIQTCSNCLTVNYCSRKHQIEHWNIHKDWCQSPPALITTNNHPNYSQQFQQNQQNYSSEQSINETNIARTLSDFNLDCESISGIIDPFDDTINNNKPLISNTSELFMSNSKVFLTLPQPEQVVTSQYCRADSSTMNNYAMQEYVTGGIETQESVKQSQIQNKCSSIVSKLLRYCKIILNDMNQYGFCVIDDFLQNGDSILNEVHGLYQHGHFRNGELVSKVTTNTKQIRGDEIIWIDGTEDGCSNIAFLMRILDSLVAYCNSSRFGQFAYLDIFRRTKAMLACYPGNYSKYVRHIDNPNRDGRCITSIYYLNKNYDKTKDGGMLRLFPQMNKNIVADIEPKFNRVIFFWSDRRNPHEVMPSSRLRFAITVWYFDDKERSIALQRYKQNNLRCPSDRDLVPF